MEATQVLPDGELVGIASAGERPGALHTVVESRLCAVPEAYSPSSKTRKQRETKPSRELWGASRGGVPETHGAVLGARDEDGQARVEAHGTHVVGVAV